MTGKKRGTSAEEKDLFAHAVKDAKPLARRTHALHVPTHVIPHLPERRIAQAPHFPDLRAHPIGGHVEARARRGRADIEGRLDLHGLTQEGAYRRLLGFLFDAQMDGKRLVLVITGKGGVLRNLLPFWLGQEELKRLVSGVSDAHASHGGTGAYYVALRKRMASLPPQGGAMPWHRNP